MAKKIILIIMDGWGLGVDKAADAIQQARVPFIDALLKNYPNSTLVTYGEAVGLPAGQMGNSEVGHLNIGAGRVVYQELERINKAIKDKDFFENKVLLSAIDYAIANKKPLHLMGLVSDGGVHAHIRHLEAILDLCKTKNLTEVYIHAFTDGRDCDPKSGAAFIQTLEAHTQKTVGKIATVIGRYYAMDRDKRWERVKIAYDALINGKGNFSKNLVESIENSYAAGVTDEFLMPIINENIDIKRACIQPDDAVICFNYRTDRCREITEVLTQKDFPEYGMYTLPLFYTTMTEYDACFKNVQVVFETDNLNNTLGEVLERNHKTQIRIAETEKYPHVTFFFSGGREQAFEGEERIIIPSPKVATYDLQPEMSAVEITKTIIPIIEKEAVDFVCLNFANPDMVGHTGVLSAVIKAVETVNDCVEKITPIALAHNYDLVIIADHGNADNMVNKDGSPNTQHSTNLVPFIFVSNEPVKRVKNGKLGDIAPTILKLMQIPIPPEMTGEILIEL